MPRFTTPEAFTSAISVVIYLCLGSIFIWTLEMTVALAFAGRAELICI
jgi:hypothetical protein